MKKDGFTKCAKMYISRLREENRNGTAHVYQSALLIFLKFAKKDRVAFKFINRDKLKEFEVFLDGRECKPNTISTYMRSIRCFYWRSCTYTPIVL